MTQTPLPAMTDLMRLYGDKAGQDPLLSRSRRYLLLAKARWFFLGLAAVYGGVAGLVYAFSPVGWFLSRCSSMASC